ncbi:MAG: hypothetical protein COA73_01470 [Candidatus Hydrogenedentota bacterium]|nr:MAG: hypothetical protein COA73_01470 [Candidatus Hydrogenedentota bacterium]
MKPATLKNEAFLASIAEAKKEANRVRGTERESLYIWWLGQSGFLILWDGQTCLFDPYLSDSLTRKYADTERPHVRMTERVIDPALLTGIDVVTSTHNHTDHLDAETLNPLRDANPGMRMLIPETNRAFVVERLGCHLDWPIGVTDGEIKTIGDMSFTGIPAAHPELDRDEQGRSRYLGYVLKIGPWKIYHSGDTVMFDGLAEQLAPHQIDIALLPINGVHPDPDIAGNLDGNDAAQLALSIGASVVIPCHYDMFEFNTATTELFEKTCDMLGQSKLVMEAGRREALPGVVYCRNDDG